MNKKKILASLRKKLLREMEERLKLFENARKNLLHNFYNGAENIFKTIASVFGNRVDKEEWHSALLKRMSLDIEDVRPKVISKDLYKKLPD